MTSKPRARRGGHPAPAGPETPPLEPPAKADTPLTEYQLLREIRVADPGQDGAQLAVWVTDGTVKARSQQRAVEAKLNAMLAEGASADELNDAALCNWRAIPVSAWPLKAMRAALDTTTRIVVS